jgi:hypothetical protein
MTAALQVFNDAGTLQIDTQFINYVLVGSGYINFPAAGTPPVNIQKVTFTNTGWTAPIMVVAYSNGYYGSQQGAASVIGRSEGIDVENPTNYLHNFWVSSQTPSGWGATVSYYVYDVQPNVAPSSYGLATYDSSGRVTFSSDYEPMRIIGFASIPYGTPVDGYGVDTFTVNGTFAGQKLAAAFDNPKSYVNSDPYGSGWGRQWFQTVYINNNMSTPAVATGAYDPAWTASTSAINRQQPVGGNLFAVDVTNVYLP